MFVRERVREGDREEEEEGERETQREGGRCAVRTERKRLPRGDS